MFILRLKERNDMQYILTEEEYKNLISRPTHEQYDRVQANALKAGGHLIDEIGCEERRGGYCDDCPLSENESACTRYRDYSQ
jgi:hypothetical protein